MKKKLSKVLSILLALSLVFEMLPANAFAAETGDDYEYEEEYEVGEEVEEAEAEDAYTIDLPYIEGEDLLLDDSLSASEYAAAKEAYAQNLADMYNVSELDGAYGYIGNEYVKCYVNNNGAYNIGTPDNKCLLFDFPYCTTSDTLVRINGKDYFFGISGSTTTTISSDGKSATSVWTMDGVEVTQKLEVAKTPNKNTYSTIKISYTYKNTTLKVKKVGIRIMLDTMLGSNDGSPFVIKSEKITKEKEYVGAAIPFCYYALDSLENTTIQSTGYLYDISTTTQQKPDKVQICRWPGIRGSSWNYTVNTNDLVTRDSAVAIYFNEKSVPALKSNTVYTYYGSYDIAAEYVCESFNYRNDRMEQGLMQTLAEYSAYAYQDYYSLTKDNQKYFAYDKDFKGKVDSSAKLDSVLMDDNYDLIESYNYRNPTEDTATYTLASKKVNHEGKVRDLVLVVVRGTNKVEWKGNMDITGESYNSAKDDHKSFLAGANEIKNKLSEYVSDPDNDITNPIVLITGHSRGGAITNLLAYMLTNGALSCVDSEKIYAYGFAVPNTTLNADHDCNNIYNFVLEDDFVPSMPLSAWGYSKHGKIYMANAYDLSKSNANFKKYETASVKASGQDGYSFDKKIVADTIKKVKSDVADNEKYYTKKFKASGEDNKISLWKFMHDHVAPAAMGESDGTDLFLTQYRFNVLAKVADLFVAWFSQRGCIGDTHNMFTYYNAIKANAFSEVDTATLELDKENSYENIVAYTNIPESGINSAEMAALVKLYNENETTLQSQGWSKIGTSITACPGVYWDDEYRVSKIELPGLELGSQSYSSIDLSAFTSLKYVDISYNNFNSITLPDSLLYVDISHNRIKDIASYNFEDCEIAFVDYQRPDVYSYSYDANDVNCLKGILGQNSSIWNISSAPENWYGVTWELINNKYRVTKLELSDSNLSGNLNVSALTELISLSIGGNKFTSVNASGCTKLQVLTCANNKITSISVNSSVLSCFKAEGNYLDKNTTRISAEYSDLGRQKVSNSSNFATAEVSALSAYAVAMGEQSNAPGDWSFVEWEKKSDGRYHTVTLDISGVSDATGRLDLSGFTSLTKVKAIGSAITEVVLPASLTTIDEMAFASCDKLQKVTINAGTQIIGKKAFYGCSSLKEIILPNGVKKIEEGAFEKDKALTSVFVPASVTNIGDRAFSSTKSLSSIYFGGNAPATGTDVFAGSAIDMIIHYLSGTTGWGSGIWTSFFAVRTDKLSVAVSPNKLTYEVGETPDLTGIKLFYWDGNGHQEYITSGYTLLTTTPFTAEGISTVKVSCKGEIATFEVTVVASTFVCSDVTITSEKKGLRLKWSAVVGATGYKIYYKSGSKWKLKKTISNGNTTSYTDTKAKTNGKQYQYKIIPVSPTRTCPTVKVYTAYYLTKPTLKSASSSSRKLKVSFKKNSKASGYEVQYSYYKNFVYSSTVKVGKTKTSATIKNLYYGSYYYVRVRAYKKYKNKYYYSNWSAVKKVRIK